MILESNVLSELGICTEPALVVSDHNTHLMLSNMSGFTQHLEEGTEVGLAEMQTSATEEG